MANSTLEEDLERLGKTVDEILEAASLHANATDQRDQENYQDILRRQLDKSPDGTSSYYVLKNKINNHLRGETDSARQRAEKRFQELEKKMQKALVELGVIIPGKACSAFVSYCNRNKSLIVMRVWGKDGICSTCNFVIQRDKDAQWEIIQQLVEAEKYPIKLTLRSNRRIDITNIFRDQNKSTIFNANRFARYIRNDTKGCKATYSLVPTHAIDKRTKKD